jgi:hypothetical protein
MQLIFKEASLFGVSLFEPKSWGAAETVLNVPAQFRGIQNDSMAALRIP